MLSDPSSDIFSRKKKNKIIEQKLLFENSKIGIIYSLMKNIKSIKNTLRKHK